MSNLFKLILLAMVLTALSIVSISFGAVEFSVGKIINILLFNPDNEIDALIIWQSRIPRIIAAILIGCYISVAGVLFQAVTRNPLADPGILGVSSGASFAVVLSISVFPYIHLPVQLIAFAGGLLAAAAVFLLTWKNGVQPIRLILSGVVINSTLGAGISFLMITFPEIFQGALFWLNGSLTGKTQADVSELFLFGIPGLAAALLGIKKANLIVLGEDLASNLGLELSKAIIILCLIASYLTGISVCTSGIIGFLGLLSPHISRLIVGPNHKWLLPFSALLGSVILVGADMVSRVILRPVEVPVGIIMAIIGGPFFIYLLRKKGGYSV